MKFDDALNIIYGKEKLGYTIHFFEKEIDGNELLPDHFPDQNICEDLIGTVDEAWLYAKRFAKNTKGKYVNIHICDGQFKPVPGYYVLNSKENFMNVLKQKIVLEEIEISEKEAFSKFITSIAYSESTTVVELLYSEPNSHVCEPFTRIAGEELTDDLKQLNIDAWELTIPDFWDKYEGGLKGLWHFGKTVTI